MRGHPRVLTVVLVLFVIWSLCAVSYIEAQSRPPLSRLISELQSDRTSDRATNELLKMGKSDPDIRRYLVGQLPQIVANGPKHQSDSATDVYPCCLAWANAARLAGKLKIKEAAPALAQWIAFSTSGPLAIGLGPELRLNTRPAAKALVEIGTPAIPVVQHILDYGNATQHRIAVRVLCMMNSPEANLTLRNDLQHEQDPSIRAEIETELKRK
jgi:hypothetical protein